MRALPSENWPAAPAIKVMQDPEATSTCKDSECRRWKPYSNSKDFEREAWLIFAILFGLVFLGIAIHAVVCCIIRRRCSLRRRQQQQEEEESVNDNGGGGGGGGGVMISGVDIVGEVVVFKNSAAVAVVDCAICLSEFSEEERVMVLEGCKHGFHVNCIKQWLSSHSSCPICRAKTFLSSSSSPGGIHLKNIVTN
ncbi:RING-H2 finger protein ATL79-like [Impatiens glandulifera]|uniref:RING-H2 finger protein ATL79-like n=1 Tax=Impatiens glandulifera TaxID=253017 RepID=UPI001FB0C4D9|nr:RING-H2 finger protein ATL79-like [Impatiens glandulifera]